MELTEKLRLQLDELHKLLEDGTYEKVILHRACKEVSILEEKLALIKPNSKASCYNCKHSQICRLYYSMGNALQDNYHMTDVNLPITDPKTPTSIFTKVAEICTRYEQNFNEVKEVTERD